MKVRDIAGASAKFFLKSEYGPISSEWPVVAFTQDSFDSQLRRQYRTGDFIVYLGTKDGKTLQREDRGALLSVVEIDTTAVLNTYDYISPSNRAWAEKEYDGQWLKCFRALRAFDLPHRAYADDTLTHTECNLWHVPFREISGEDYGALLEQEVVPIADVDVLAQPDRMLGPADLLRPENSLEKNEACRLASLVMNRVNCSGQTINHRAPERSAPTNLILQIFTSLLQKPLLCKLCKGEMPLKTTNKLLRISGDRKDSAQGDYGPENYQLVHQACNLAKNNASEEDFFTWLQVAAARMHSSRDEQLCIDSRSTRS